MVEVDLGHVAETPAQDITNEDLVRKLVQLPVGNRISTDFGDMVRVSASEFKFEINKEHYEGVVKSILDSGMSV
ncbi:hypothetical protein NVP1031O_135 [Vibrio phage 1.031.O._10N.261.46.F8]|nr:hypothetical protein NVP1031O_135 [Vibrio phage 1.031.O._10N.261.46.F8]